MSVELFGRKLKSDRSFALGIAESPFLKGFEFDALFRVAFNLICRRSIKMLKWSFLISILLGLMFTVADSMRFDLQSGATKCISDDIKTNAMTVGKYSVVNLNEGFPIPDSHKLTVRVLLFTFPFPIQCFIFSNLNLDCIMIISILF